MTALDAATSATPLADAFVGDGIGVPPGLADRLRGTEKYARRLEAQLAEAAARPDAVSAVVRSAEELHALLHDGRRSLLLRTLRRPVRQLGDGSPALATLARTTKAMFGRARGALALQEQLDAFHAEYRDDCKAWWRDVPYVAGRLLRSARLTPDDVARVSRAADVPPMLQRLRTIRAELDDLAGYLPAPDEMAAMERSDAWPPGVRPEELIAKVRQAARADPAHADTGRRQRGALVDAARHVARLAAAGGSARVASRASQAVAEALAAQALAGPSAGARVDEALWSGLVRAARRALVSPEEGWLPQLGEVAETGAEDEGWGSVQFVTPILGEWALISRRLHSAVRVRELRVELGKRFTCAPHTPEGAFAPLPAVHRQVAPLFDGVLDDAATYAVAVPAELVPYARIGDEWLAMVKRRGTLRPVRPTASTARLRVVRSAADPVHLAPVPVEDRREPARSFQEVRTRVVDAPYAEHPIAWWKGPESASPAARDHLANEARFFSDLGARMADRMLRPLGTGTCGGVEGLLYAPPQALLPATTPALARWLVEARPAFLRAASRLWMELGRHGHGLGLYHWDAFAVRVTVRPDGEPAPVLVVVEAPHGVALGQAYRRSPPTHVEGPLYPMLGLRRLPPAVQEGAVATPETEVAAFALFAIEMLARRPLELDPRIPWNALPVALEARPPEFFANPTLAISFARALTDAGAAQQMVRVIEAYASRPDD